jgi:uncharacterized radical SAM superfamily Fe-S cluster-containing enzyme
LEVLKKTRSICPECFNVIDATIYEDDGQVLMRKECLEHGVFEDIYWSNFKEYTRAQKYAVIGKGIENFGNNRCDKSMQPPMPNLLCQLRRLGVHL